MRHALNKTRTWLLSARGRSVSNPGGLRLSRHSSRVKKNCRVRRARTVLAVDLPKSYALSEKLLVSPCGVTVHYQPVMYRRQFRFWYCRDQPQSQTSLVLGVAPLALRFALVLRWPYDVVDDQRFRRSFLRFESQPKLLLQSGKKGRPIWLR